MTENPFPEWLTDVAADAVVTLPEDTIAEARGNLWTFGLDNEQRAAVTTADIEEFVRSQRERAKSRTLSAKRWSTG